MIRAGIIGASGYTGVELSRLLSRHPKVEIAVATSRQYAGKMLSEVYPSLTGVTGLVCEDVVPENLVDRVDVLFTAVPHQTAMDIVPVFLEAGKKVIDLSADFRIDDPAVYEEWYQPHTATQYFDEAVYGLPELNREKISGARLVANPGCYPTSIILGMAPLLREGIIDVSTIIADSKSGTSGAGRSAQVGSLFCEVADGFRAYKVGGQHRHTPEIEQELTKLAGKDIVISFTPHLLPVSRGILSTIYSTMVKKCTQEDIDAIYDNYYANEYFVRVCKGGALPSTQNVRGSNFCDIAVKVDPRTGRVIVLSVIDNLVKGAAGQAIQNMNLVCGFDEGLGLDIVPLFP
ncbi:MAG: N-acetyl-gamma-glutamyl-phosphate reductase [Desulfobulbaceae bacterium]|uniref:N-acetyl-gamma-glutamyl-phosphate reductase n=1 Tax=Candidatus Desulfobia pelagia TaxID=2841692 RepID=A0A8J6NH02_9BACT|nr:N-acetyl-gamma-glutamyl-phosphate reductase [Candidatus Desulfobia pelagia]